MTNALNLKENITKYYMGATSLCEHKFCDIIIKIQYFGWLSYDSMIIDAVCPVDRNHKKIAGWGR